MKRNAPVAKRKYIALKKGHKKLQNRLELLNDKLDANNKILNFTQVFKIGKFRLIKY